MGHIRQSSTALFTRFPANGRIPFKQVASATWIATTALLVGIGFVLAVAFSADGKPTDENIWYSHAPTFIALGAVILRGSLAALLGIALYQNLWQSLAAPTPANGEPLLGAKEYQGLKLSSIESLHLASRLAVGMFAHPLLKAGWIVGVLGLALTSAVQPVLQSAISVGQERRFTSRDLPIYHPQFNGSLAQSDSARMLAGGPTTIPRRSAIAALIGQNNGIRYTDSNVTGRATFGPVRYLDVTCNIKATPGNTSNAFGWDVYNFTYRYPDAKPVTDDFDLSQFLDVSANSTVLYDGADIQVTNLSKIEVLSYMYNNTHYLKHMCTVQTAVGSCAARLESGMGSMGALECTRDKFINVDDELSGDATFYGSAGAVPALFSSFLEVFVGKAVLDIHGRFNFGKSLFMLGTMVEDIDQSRVMPSDLLSHMQRVLWVTPLIAKSGGPVQQALNITMSVLDERTVVVYRIDKPRVVITVAVLLIVGVGCLVYLFLCKSGASGRLVRDSLVHSLTVAGPQGPAVKGACLASLEDILEKAGDERVRYGVTLEASDMVSGHLGFAEQVLEPTSYQAMPITVLGRPVPGRWYGGQESLTKREGKQFAHGR